MQTILEGDRGAAVEDVQMRLTRLGYAIDTDELSSFFFGPSTAKAIRNFRQSQDLSPIPEIDISAWSALVNASYRLGDRTLYLRLPNYHGADVKELQRRLNILGFSCGEEDGYFGGHTEHALMLFQESIGEVADGMLFHDTFDAIERLKHIWGGKPAEGPHPTGEIGYARAANVLEKISLTICATDQISRNIAGRIWNLLKATDETCKIELRDSSEKTAVGTKTLLVLSCSDTGDLRETPSSVLTQHSDMGNLVYDHKQGFALRLCAAFQSAKSSPATVHVAIPIVQGKPFTLTQAQSYAVELSDAVCEAFARFEK